MPEGRAERAGEARGSCAKSIDGAEHSDEHRMRDGRQPGFPLKIRLGSKPRIRQDPAAIFVTRAAHFRHESATITTVNPH
jgi:hypothetical protein